jgi:hypothetical protein
MQCVGFYGRYINEKILHPLIACPVLRKEKDMFYWIDSGSLEAPLVFIAYYINL